MPGLAAAQLSPQEAMPIVILGMASGTVFLLGVIGMAFVFSFRKTRQRLELIERLIGQGHPVPPQLLFGKAVPLPPREQQRVDLRRGIALLGWAIGISLLMYFGFGQLRAAAWGLLFLFLSLASFVNAYFSGRAARERDGSDAP
jgi:hypothetical protein